MKMPMFGLSHIIRAKELMKSALPFLLILPFFCSPMLTVPNFSVLEIFRDRMIRRKNKFHSLLKMQSKSIVKIRNEYFNEHKSPVFKIIRNHLNGESVNE